MAVSIVGSIGYTPTSSLTTRTLNVPAGVADGDTVLIFASKAGGTSAATISGVTATNIADVLFSGHAASVWIMDNVSSSLAGTTITFTTQTALRVAAGILVIRGLMPTALDTHTKANGLATTMVAPSAVASAQDVTVLFGSVSGNTASLSATTPSGFTKVIEAVDTGASGAAGLQVAYSLAGVASGATQAASTFTPSAQVNYTAWTILLKAKVATDTVRPILQISNAGAYTAVGAGTLVETFADESDSTYAETADTPTSATQVVKLGEITSGDINISVRAQYASPATSGTLVTKLIQAPSTVIASWTDSLTSAFANYSHVTSPGQTATITDRSNLYVQTEMTIS